MKLKTVNVIELNDLGMPTQLKSFPDDKQGNGEAELLFIQLVREHENAVSHEEMETLIDDGMWSDGGWTVLLVHST